MNWSRVRGVFFRYFYVLKKGGLQLSDLFYWPLVDILLWGLTSVWIQSQSHVSNLPLILMTGLVFWQVAWRGSIDISVSLLQEFWHRNLVNLFSTPLKISEWTMGVILLCLCKLLVTITFGAVTVYVLYSLNVFTVGWSFLPFAAALLLFGWSLGFLASSAIIYWGHQVEAFAWMIGFIFAPFSAVFYPVETLPHWAQSISWCLPTTYIFEGMRSVLKTGTFPTEFFWISLGLDLVCLGLSISLFNYMFQKSRIKGLARLE
ncbi:MAG: ABC transporter permease [Verrucomicrobia bacterium]|nr:ABC transporter permease [Verrucomicrobiota bacterium]